MTLLSFGRLQISISWKPKKIPQPIPSQHSKAASDTYHPNLAPIRALAAKYTYRELWHRPDEARVRFKQGADTIVDVWYKTMTVGTVLTHPSKGRKQLFRKDMSMALVESILKNPRVHTSEGFYKSG